jgi:hypothetical protein
MGEGWEVVNPRSTEPAKARKTDYLLIIIIMAY